jgi:YVTN family beta-propeller protein
MATATCRGRDHYLTALALCCVSLAGVVLDGQGNGKYVPARPGWLYVVASDFRAKAGSITIVDPGAGRVVGSLSKGYEPDLALSLDGRRLFLSYVEEQPDGQPRGVFEVIDARTGTVIDRRDDPDPWPSRGMAYTSRMALSRDGEWLYRFKLSDSLTASGYVEVFDTSRNVVKAKTPVVSLCSPATLVPGDDRRTLYLACAKAQDVRRLVFDDGGTLLTKPQRTSVEGGPHGEHLTAFMAPDGRTVNVIKGDARYVRVDAVSGQVAQKDAVDRVGRNVPVPTNAPGLGAGNRDRGAGVSDVANPFDWLAGRQIRRQPPVLSPDGSRVYLLTALGDDEHAGGRRNQVAVLNGETLDLVQTIGLSRPSVSITLSQDGSRLYAVDTLNASLVVIDTATGNEVRTIPGVGRRPVFAIVAR